MASSPLKRLRDLLELLSLQAKHLDQRNEKSKSNYLLKDKSLFSESIFASRSDKYFVYCQEVEKNLKNLDALLTKNQNTIANSLLERIEQQLSALHSALSGNDVIYKEAGIRQNKINVGRYKKAAKAVMQSSHQLYQQLNEYLEFERRLSNMLEERNRALTNSTQANQATLQAEVLALHQRLGRCRQAISKVERTIELAEKQSN